MRCAHFLFLGAWTLYTCWARSAYKSIDTLLEACFLLSSPMDQPGPRGSSRQSPISRDCWASLCPIRGLMVSIRQASLQSGGLHCYFSRATCSGETWDAIVESVGPCSFYPAVLVPCTGPHVRGLLPFHEMSKCLLTETAQWAPHGSSPSFHSTQEPSNF